MHKNVMDTIFLLHFMLVNLTFQRSKLNDNIIIESMIIN